MKTYIVRYEDLCQECIKYAYVKADSAEEITNNFNKRFHHCLLMDEPEEYQPERA